MASRSSFVRAACPSCGATLDLRPHGALVRCAYCGSTFESRQATAPASSKEKTAAKPRRALMVAFVVLAAGLALPVLLRDDPSPTPAAAVAPASRPAAPALPLPKPSERLFGGAETFGLVLPGNDLLFFVSENRDYALYRVDKAAGRVRWKSAPLGSSVDARRAVTDGERVFVTGGTRLQALTLTDGAPAWGASLMAEIQNRNVCADCLQVVGERVVTLQANGALQAFDAATGALVWSLRLENPPRALPVAEGRLVLRRHDQSAVELLDPGSGEVTQRLDLAFTVQYGRQTGLRASDTIVLSPDGRRLYAFINDAFDVYFQAWDLANGTRLAHKHVGAFRVNYDLPYALAGGTLYFAHDTTLYALDTGTAAARPLLADKDYQFQPLTVAGDVLIAAAAPSWDRQRWALWGVDRQTGAARWQFTPEAKTLRAVNGHGDWDAHLAPHGLVVVQSLRDESILFEVLDPQTGVSRVRRTAVANAGHLWDVNWDGNLVWLDLLGQTALDARTGTVRHHLY